MKIARYVLYFLTVIVLAVFFINASTSEGFRIRTGNSDSAVGDYGVYAIELPKSMEFCGEEVPLNLRDVSERLDREMLTNVYWQSNGFLLIKRANKFFSVIEPILEKNNIPMDFKYLAVIESGFLDVSSPSGASGFWQFMKGTAGEYGLEISEDVDERYNIEKSTEAACKFFRAAKNELGSWTLAAASYNMGRRGVKNQMEKQKVKNYYDLLLNEETNRYVFRILALKEIMSNPKKYGFNYNDNQLYNRYAVEEIEVKDSIENLAEFAIEKGINYKMLKLYNPWLRSNKLGNKDGKIYKIKIPRVE